jgi:hypothetical protein
MNAMLRKRVDAAEQRAKCVEGLPDEDPPLDHRRDGWLASPQFAKTSRGHGDREDAIRERRDPFGMPAPGGLV